MSIIVYGPQGCGKTRNAAVLLKAFKLTKAVDADDTTELRLPRNDLYYAWAHQPHRGTLERKRLLILTHEEPPTELLCDRRVLSFQRAMFLATAREVAA